MENEKQQKLMYIMQHVAENGYDTTKFNKFLTENYSGSKQVENMSMQQVVAVVSDYQKFKDNSHPQPLIKKQVDQDLLNQQTSHKRQQKAKKSEKPFIRKSQITKSLTGINKTDLNQRQVTMEITKAEVVKAGIFSSDYVEFHVLCEIPSLQQKHLVQRKDADFYHLRQVLTQQYPYTLIPPLPKIKETKCQEKDIKSRHQLYDRFLIGISRSEVLKSCRFVQQFLTITDKKYWKIEKEGHEKIKFNRRIEDVINPDGQVSVEDRQDSKKFCDEVRNFSAVYAHIVKEATSLSKEVHEMSENLANSVGKLSLCVRDFGKLFKKVKVNSQYKLFQRLSDLFRDQSRNVQQQGYLTKIYLGQAMKYYDQEQQPLEELVSFRDQFRIDYARYFKDVEDRKSSLFKQDPRTWGYTQGSMDDLVAKSNDLLKDRQKAYRYMLSADTQKLQEMGEELSFYTNQCLDEVRRVGKDNGVALIDHFMDQGKIQCDYLQEQFDKWSEFQAYFGSRQWDRPEREKKSRKRKNSKNDDFELIDDSDEQDEPPSQLAESVKEDGFELVSATNNRNSVRVTEIQLDQESVGRQTKVISSVVQDNIDATLQKLLQTESQVAKTPSPQASTDQTSEKSLLQTPTVTINKKKSYRRTAPLQENQSKVPGRQQSQPPQQPTSHKLQISEAISDRSTPTEQQQSNNSMPLFADPQVSSDQQVSSSDNHTSQDPSSQKLGSHDSEAQNPKLSHQSGSSQQPPHKSTSHLFAFDLQQQHMSQEIIFEESEKNSSEEQTLRNDTIVMDMMNQNLMNQSLMNHGELSERTARNNTVILTKTERPPAREQTLTEQIRPIGEESKVDVKPGFLLDQIQEAQAQILEAQEHMKRAQPNYPQQYQPIKLSPVQPETKQYLKPLTSLIDEKNVKKQPVVNQMLNSKRQSILTFSQVEKLQHKGEGGFLTGLPKLKPVTVTPKSGQQKVTLVQGSIQSSSARDFKQETAIQKAIRKIQEGEGSSDDSCDMQFS